MSDEVALASFVLHQQDSVHLQVKGYGGLTDATLFEGRLAAGAQQTVDIPYRGLVLLKFEKGPSYTIILGKQFFTLHIKNPNPPTFTGSSEN